MERPDATTLRRIAALIGVLAGIAFVVLVWLGSSDLRNDLLVPNRDAPLAEVEVVTVGGGRIGLVRSAATEMEGMWGVRGDGSFGIVGDIVELREDVVVRSVETIDGVFSIGDTVAWDPLIYRGDPATALGIDYEPIRIPGELGVNPAWFIDGRQDTWVIIVHGRDARLDQSLRLLPALVGADYPILVTSYRGDGLAPDNSSGRYTWGVEEWPEVEDAVRWTQGQGAQSVALIGIGMGGSVVAQFLHESTLLPVVRGVVLDSAVLDLEAATDANAADDGIPSFLHGPAKAVARLRFNLEWGVLDHVRRASEFDVSMLLLQGGLDPIASPDVAAEFAERLPDGLATLNIIDDAGHETVWNANPARYEFALLRFLQQVSPER
jgi:alpha-beta hydrolase superfamily lysophospholipase